MKRAFLCLLLTATLVPTRAQEFLASADYVYGCASDRSEAKADSLALISLSRSVKVDVKNIIESKYKECDGKITQTVNSQTNVQSNLSISGVKKYVTYTRKIYTVYYYFNKKEYVDNCMLSYHENMNKALLYKSSNEPHAKNLYLGYLYLAYESISDEMLECFFPAAEVMKNNIIDKISDKYSKMGYLLSARNVGDKNPSKTFLIRDENAKTLPGFEYYTTDGNWNTPLSFLNGECKACEENSAKWAYIHHATKEYRFVFEVEHDYGRMKLNVPTEFYNKISKPIYFFF